MERVQLLLHHGITPYIVFDGGPLPAKKGTEVDRSKKREEALGKAEALQAQGRRKEARDAYAKCVDVTPEMALQWIKVSLVGPWIVRASLRVSLVLFYCVLYFLSSPSSPSWDAPSPVLLTERMKGWMIRVG